jgi:hypothetical protein
MFVFCYSFLVQFNYEGSLFTWSWIIVRLKCYVTNGVDWGGGRLYLKKCQCLRVENFIIDSNKIYKLYTYNKEKVDFHVKCGFLWNSHCKLSHYTSISTLNNNDSSW